MNPLIGKYVNLTYVERSGRIVAAGGETIWVEFNWSTVDKLNREVVLGVPLSRRIKYVPHQLVLNLSDTQEFITDKPKYQPEPVAFFQDTGIIQSIQRRQEPTLNKPHQSAAMQVDGSLTSLRNGSDSSQEIEIMAKCAVFDSENLLVAIYDSKKEAKAHNKGTDLQFIDAKNFPEDGIGEYATVEDLFPPKEAPVKEDTGEKRTRGPVAEVSGSYSVVKADAARFPAEDSRAQIHKALVENNSFEAFFAATPESYTFTTSRGKEITEKPVTFARYALRRGWISVGEVVVEAE